MKEQNTYQKLFNINYNNKIFTIFIDKYGRRTFLELKSNDKYKYPNIDDFIYLNKIYNERNPFISYYGVGDRLPIHKPKKVMFKEAVISTTGIISIILTGVIGINSVRYSYSLEKKNEYLEIVPTHTYTNFDDSNVLDRYLGSSSVPIEELIDVINNNPNLDDIYKKDAIILAKYIYEKYPNTDNRIFYDNMKTITINELEDSAKNEYIAGTYNSQYNTINIKNKNVTEEKSIDSNSFENQVIIHELAHAYHCWANNSVVNTVYRSPNIGQSLDEAMNNKVIEGLFEDGTSTYQNEGKILDYLLTFVNYSYYDYEQGGIDRLYNLLKNKYPEVDIDYIFNFTDTMYVSSVSQGKNIMIELSPEFLDCSFDLCIHNINYDNCYESLINFIKLINYNSYRDIVAKYTDEYNQILSMNGIQELLSSDDIINKINEKESIEAFNKYLIKLNFNDIDPNDVYKPLENFFITKSPNNLFTKLLNKYNDYLISHGITEEKIITTSEFNDKIQKYQNITVTGYYTTKDGKIYLRLDIPENDRLYNQEEKVPVLDQDGKIILLDLSSIYTGTNDERMRNVFTYYIFKNKKDDLSWYNDNFFYNEYNISPFDYRKVNITLNGKTICNDLINHYKVIIGSNEDGTNSFKLIDWQNNILYNDGNSINKVPINLKYYLNLTSYTDTIELTNYFNKDYLKQFALTSSNDINKEYIVYDKINDKVICKQRPTIIIDDDIDNEIEMKYVYIASYRDKDTDSITNYMVINNFDYVLGNDIELHELIYLSDVLRYYGLFDKNKFPYKFTIEEIKTIFNNYLNDTLINTPNIDKPKQFN